MQLLDPLLVDVEAHDREAGAGERDRYRKSDVTETDYRNIASRCQNIPLLVWLSGFEVSRKSVSAL
jgi:hypothetical protein